MALSIALLWTLPAFGGPPRRTKTLKGHDNFVTSLDITAEGRLVASGSADGTVRIWSVEAGRARKTIRLGEGQTARRVLFSPDGKTLAVAFEGTVLLVATGSGEEKRRIDAGQEVLAIAFSPDGGAIAVAAGGLRVYSLAGGEEIERGPEQIVAVAFAPDGRALALAGKDGVRLRARIDGAERRLQEAAARQVIFAPDGKSLITAGDDGQVRAVALEGAELWAHADLAADGTLGSTGSLVLAGIGDRRIWALSGDKGNEEWFLEGKTDDLQTFALAPQAKILATAGEGGSIDIWAWK